MYKKHDVVTFKDELVPLTVQELHQLGGLTWIVATDRDGNRTWATEEAFRPYSKRPRTRHDN